MSDTFSPFREEAMRERLRALPANIPAALTGGGLFVAARFLLHQDWPLALAVSLAGYLVAGLLIFPGVSSLEAARNKRLAAVLKDGGRKLAEMTRLQKEIRNPQARQSVAQLAAIGANIFEALQKNPQQVGAAQQFSACYLDATNAIIEKYLHLARHQAYSADVKTALASVERALTEIRAAYEKQLTGVLQDVVVDLNAELAVLEEIREIERLPPP